LRANGLRPRQDGRQKIPVVRTAELRRLLKRRLAAGRHNLERQLVRSGRRLQDGDDEASAMRGGQARNIDLAEDADRADLAVLGGERVVA